MISRRLVTGIVFIVKDEKWSCVTATVLVCHTAVLFSFSGAGLMITQVRLRPVSLEARPRADSTAALLGGRRKNYVSVSNSSSFAGCSVELCYYQPVLTAGMC